VRCQIRRSPLSNTLFLTSRALKAACRLTGTGYQSDRTVRAGGKLKPYGRGGKTRPATTAPASATRRGTSTGEERLPGRRNLPSCPCRRQLACSGNRAYGSTRRAASTLSRSTLWRRPRDADAWRIDIGVLHCAVAANNGLMSVALTRTGVNISVSYAAPALRRTFCPAILDKGLPPAASNNLLPYLSCLRNSLAARVKTRARGAGVYTNILSALLLYRHKQPSHSQRASSAGLADVLPIINA